MVCRQKREEAAAAAGARLWTWIDASPRPCKETEECAAQVISGVKATRIVTHWKHSIHPDHEAAYVTGNHAALPAAAGSWKGVRSIVHAENGEEQEAFQPWPNLRT